MVWEENLPEIFSFLARGNRDGPKIFRRVPGRSSAKDVPADS